MNKSECLKYRKQNQKVSTLHTKNLEEEERSHIKIIKGYQVKKLCCFGIV